MELWHYYSQNYSYIWEEFYQHFLMSAYGVFFAALVAIPVGIFIARHAYLSQWVFSLTNIILTIPALAMLAVLMLIMGLGQNTAIASFFLYSWYNFFRSTNTSLRNIVQTLI